MTLTLTDFFSVLIRTIYIYIIMYERMKVGLTNRLSLLTTGWAGLSTGEDTAHRLNTGSVNYFKCGHPSPGRTSRLMSAVEQWSSLIDSLCCVGVCICWFRARPLSKKDHAHFCSSASFGFHPVLSPSKCPFSVHRKCCRNVLQQVRCPLHCH